MSISNKKTLYLIHGLPSGGARTLFELNKKFLSDKYHVHEIVEPYSTFSNIFHYLYKLYFANDTWEQNQVKNMKKNPIYICYHSWLTKSPNILKYLKGTIIYICHEPPREYYDEQHIKNQSIKEKIINILRKRIIQNDLINVRNVSIIIANSEFSKKVLKKIYNKKVKVVYPGVKVSKNNRNYQVGDSKIIKLLNVGSLNKLKNQLFIVKVAKQLAKKINVHLTLVSNGFDESYCAKIQREIANENRLKVTFKLNIKPNELETIYNLSDIFVYSPINEPFGLVVLEAMSHGLPVVARKGSGGFTEILNKRNSILLDNSDQKIWANEIYNLFNNAVNKRYESLSKYSMQTARYWSDLKMNNNILKIIKSL